VGCGDFRRTAGRRLERSRAPSQPHLAIERDNEVLVHGALETIGEMELEVMVYVSTSEGWLRDILEKRKSSGSWGTNTISTPRKVGSTAAPVGEEIVSLSPADNPASADREDHGVAGQHLGREANHVPPGL
jgi:hypothetical protein